MTETDPALPPAETATRVDTVVGMPAGQPEALRQAFRALSQHRRNLVPVVGSGLALAAGAPGERTLIAELQAAAARTSVNDDLFELADALEEQHGTAWVQERIAETFRGLRVHATRTLRSLVRLPTGIVATTNYDDAIAIAARDVGLEPRIFHGGKLNEGLRVPADGDLHILHLHGHHGDPRSLVLTEGSYDRAAEDPALAQALRQLASEHVLVFLGQRLGVREEHLHRDLLWAADTFEETGPHYIFLQEGELPRSDLDELAAAGAATVVTPFRNDDGTFEVVDLAAQHIGLGVPSAGVTLPRDADARRVDTYLEVPVVPSDELSDPSERAAWQMLGTAFNRNLDLSALLGHPRAMLFGDPGSGKTQTLLQAGHATGHRHAVYRSLGNVRTTDLPASAVDVFISWVARGSAFRDGVPQPDRKTLREHVFLFLLDGLDEVPRDQRGRVLEIIEEIATSYPHHQFVIASRPYHGSDRTIPAGFEPFELVPDRTWFRAYIEHVGITPTQVERVVPDDAPLQDLLRLPIFATAVANAARRNEPLPRSPMRAILSVATVGLEREELLLHDPEVVDPWLDALAVIAETRHTNELPVDVALRGDVAQPFDLEPDEQLLDHLIERSLLVSSHGRVSFHANVVGEARAARSILGSRRGLELLHTHALVELADGTRGVHPSWRNTIELLCYDASSPEWRTTVGQYDARLAARSTPPEADQTERRSALGTLLDWYDEHPVWWQRSDDGQLRGDLDAVAALASDDELRSVAITWARDRLDAEDRALRGNALMLLTRFGETAMIEEVLPAVLHDPDPVVRRIAAEAHNTLQLEGYSDELRAALDANPDDLEERQLLAEYIRTGREADVVEFLLDRWPGEMDSWRATRALDARFSRMNQLTHLNDADAFIDSWVSHLLDGDDPWTEDEVRLLAELLYREPDRARRRANQAQPILRQQLAIALPIVWNADPGAAQLLLHRSTTDELSSLLDGDLPADLEDEISDLVERRRRPPEAREPHEQPDQQGASSERPHTLTEAATQGWDAVAALPIEMLDEDLDDDRDERLRRLTEDAWEAALEGEEGPMAGVLRLNDTQVRAPMRTFALLHLAARYRLDIDRETWLRLAEIGWHGDDFDQWLRSTFDPAWFPEVQDLVPTLSTPALNQVATVLPPASMPTDLAVALGIKLANVGRDYDLRMFLTRLADAGCTEALQRIHARRPTRLTLEALVRAGDCDAELELLEEETDAPLPSESWGSRDDHWLAHVRCEDSVSLLVDRIVHAESEDADHGYRTVLHAALRRAAGLEGLRIYDSLMDDRPFPDAAFLWFRRAELRDELLAGAVVPGPEDAALTELVDALRDQRP